MAVELNEHQLSSIRPVLASAHSVSFEVEGEVVVTTIRDAAGNARTVETNESGGQREVE